MWYNLCKFDAFLHFFICEGSMENFEIINKILKKNNINVDENAVKKLNKYYEILVDYNNKFNLTSITDIEGVALKHFADSMVKSDIYEPNATLLDVGSGAGFPGIPLAIIRPDLKITLVDSLNKRIEFLNVVIEELQLNNVNAQHSRAQEFCTADRREKFDYCTARAVAPMNILLELCVPFIKVGGCFVGYKSINLDTEMAEAKNAMEILGVKECAMYDIELVGLDENAEVLQRKIIQLKKQKSCPKKYPRPKNLIKLKPIC